MKTIRIEMVLRAEEPIAHFRETIDNEAIFAREDVKLAGGGFVQIPYIQIAGSYQASSAVAQLDLFARNSG